MARLLSTYGPDAAKLRWREPYVSEAINRKADGNQTGIIRGFRIEPAIAPSFNSFRILRDPTTGDSCAAVKDVNGRVIHVFDLADQTFTLFPLPPAVGIYNVCLVVDYTLGVSTTARLMLLTDADMVLPAYAGKTSVLGQIDYDGITNLDWAEKTLGYGGSLASAPTVQRPYQRNIAQMERSEGMIPMKKCLMRGKADENIGDVNDDLNLKEWFFRKAIATSQFQIDDTDPQPGRQYSFVLRDTVAGMNNIVLIQRGLVRVSEGDIVRIRFMKKVSFITPADTISFLLGLWLYDAVHNEINIVQQVVVVVQQWTAVDAGAYIEIVATLRVTDMGGTPLYGVPTIGIDSASPCSVFLDDIDIQIENRNAPDESRELDSGVAILAPAIRIASPNLNFSTDPPGSGYGDMIDWVLYPKGQGDGTTKNQRIAHDLILVQPVASAGERAILEIASQSGLRVGDTPTMGSRRMNTMYRKNTPKAWASILGGAASPALPAINDSFGVSAITHPAIGVYSVVFETPIETAVEGTWMADHDYAVTFGCGTPVDPKTPYLISHGNIAIAGFDIIVRIWNKVTKEWDLDDATGFHVGFEVIGK